MYIKTLSVSSLNNYIKKVLDNDFILNNAYIKGEISNFKWHSSGHIYFSLKDEYSKIKCVMFKGYAKNLKFIPEEGMKVVVKGHVSVYQKEGAYQLYCDEMEPEGLGELYIAFQKLKEKLEKEGLFDESHKKPIPKYAQKIGVITSPTGAAIRDIINVTKRRNKNIDILIYPTLVQGTKSSEDIIKALKTLDNIKDIDIIILARGGGSIEELWSFNDENLAKAIYNCKKPIITGVGHEIDFTIADFVSDRRAPTPSAAAEIAVFDLNEFNNTIKNYTNLLNNNIKSMLKDKYSNFINIKNSLRLNSPESYIVNQYTYIDKLIQNLNYTVKNKLEREKQNLGKINALLSANNPLNILNKGYAVVQDEKNNVISKIDKIKKVDKIKITLKDGTALGKFILEE
ncbi:exodeoxyribonuclease 7 large subunit [Clostridium acetireducens DSM 10703]|jgi:exodeoxyribonuclease VII large subunit|uniref:Exodeoxyribonuclease 7 large subunit n=1 Tax=Clostridium acetireducens DSM 10703 TaxID=1121290 RepID=A0A1E8F1T6_9CLOT|nr:exodeoxyribonuclease VII large subunit [Clostridium acetireducens]OFI07598.1 exodeoxyribonuclease 7 large subunit [Clostridium acetireducens DSM 10703]